MTRMNIYLTFSGNCREAMTFYQKCLGGELSFQTLGESPKSELIPFRMKDYILQATLIKGNTNIVATDMVDEQGLIRGNSISILVDCNTERDLIEYFKKLASGGKETYPVEKKFQGGLFGMLEDKFGIHWLLNYNSTI